MAIAPFPEIPPYDDADHVFDSGHLWITEWIVGDPLRFQLTHDGFVRFGTDEQVLAHDEIPLGVQTAVRTVRNDFDRSAFRAAVDDTESVTFHGVATHSRTLPYDLDDIPAFVGTAIYDETWGRSLPPDTVEKVFDRVNLASVDPIDREVRAADLDPARYQLPTSAWLDGTAPGVVFVNKGGGRAYRAEPRDAWPTGANDDTTAGVDDATTAESASEVVSRWVTDEWVRDRIDSCGPAETVEAITAHALRRLAREVPTVGTEAGRADTGVSVGVLRSALAERIAEEVS